MKKEFIIDRILLEIKKYPYGISRKKVAEHLNLSMSTMASYWNKARKDGYFKKIGYGLFVLTKSGEETSAGVRRKDETLINVHAIQLAFPILEDNSQDSFWDKVNDKFKNSKVMWKYIQAPIGLTIQKNTKQVTVQIWSQEVENPEDIESLSMRAAIYVWMYLKDNGVIVDILQVNKKTVEIAIRNKQIEGIIPKGNTVRIDLGRDAKKIFKDDRKEPGQSWLCPTPKRSVETNDILYAQEYLRTPMMVHTILDIQERHSKNIELHLSVMKEMRDGLAKLNKTLITEKIALSKEKKSLSVEKQQRKIREYL